MADQSVLSDSIIFKHLMISGRVQGVGYRAWMAKEALKLGLKGWVRNRIDGRVEALLNGEREKVEALIAKARSGPFLAKVTDIAINKAPAEDPHDFQIKPDA